MPRSPVTSRQEAFALAFVKSRSKRQAYIEAYEPDEDAAPAQVAKWANDVFNTPAVNRRVYELIEAGAKETVFTVAEAIGRWLAIASADPNELVSLRVGACRYCHGTNHEYHWRMREYLEALDRCERENARLPLVGGGFDYDATAAPHPTCPECHGEGVHREVVKDTENLSAEGRLLFGGVKHTNTGPQIIIADRMKALENACRIIGAFTDNVRVTDTVKAMQQVVAMETTDPVAASKMYLDMISGMAA